MASVFDTIRTVFGCKQAILKMGFLSALISYPIYEVLLNTNQITDFKWNTLWSIVLYVIGLLYIGYLLVSSHNLINEENNVLPWFGNPFKILFVGLGSLFALAPIVALMIYVGICLFNIFTLKGFPIAYCIGGIFVIELLLWGILMIQWALFADKYNPLHSYKLIHILKYFLQFAGTAIPLIILSLIVTGFFFFPCGYLAHKMFGNGYVYTLVIVLFSTFILTVITQHYSQIYMEEVVLTRKVEYEDDAGKIMDKDLLYDQDNDNRYNGGY
jgi:hypothetical protein